MMHRAKKSLGQNFLKSAPALRKIIGAGEISPEDIILEIGPGKGALTEKLLLALRSSSEGGGKVRPARAGQAAERGIVVAVEKDRELFEFLKIKFEKEITEKKLILINDDILKFNSFTPSNFSSLRPSLGASGSKWDPREQKIERGSADKSEDILRNYKIIANIPYNITGAILKKFLTAENQPSLMVLMVQYEVAKRIVGPIRAGRERKESLLSVSVKAYGEPKMIMKVPARYFSPAPKVDSAIIAIKNISRKVFTENEIIEENFWKIVHAGFAHKRKKLSGNLKNVISAEKLEENGLGDKRAEDLSLKDWLALVK